MASTFLIAEMRVATGDKYVLQDTRHFTKTLMEVKE